MPIPLSHPLPPIIRIRLGELFVSQLDSPPAPANWVCSTSMLDPPCVLVGVIVGKEPMVAAGYRSTIDE
jgi:hypothetical protein